MLTALITTTIGYTISDVHFCFGFYILRALKVDIYRLFYPFSRNVGERHITTGVYFEIRQKNS